MWLRYRNRKRSIPELILFFRRGSMNVDPESLHPLKLWRMELGLSVYEVAKSAGVAEVTVLNMESGKFAGHTPILSVIRISRALLLDPTDVFCVLLQQVGDENYGFRM